MSPEEQKRRDERGKAFAEGMLDAHGQAVKDVGKRMLAGASKRVRFVGQTVPGVPGMVYDAATILSAKDKGRAIAGWVGGALGGAGGAAMGAATGPAAFVAAPVGAAVGSAAGQEFGERMYDAHAADVRAYARKVEEDLRRGAGTAKQWMAMRGAQMMAPYWPVDDYYRARGR